MLLRNKLLLSTSIGLFAITGCEKPTSDYVTHQPTKHISSTVDASTDVEVDDDYRETADYVRPTAATRPATTEQIVEEAMDGGVREITPDLPSDQRKPQQQQEILTKMGTESDSRQVNFRDDGEMQAEINTEYRQPIDPDDYDSNNPRMEGDQLNPDALEAPPINEKLEVEPE